MSTEAQSAIDQQLEQWKANPDQVFACPTGKARETWTPPTQTGLEWQHEVGMHNDC